MASLIMHLGITKILQNAYNLSDDILVGAILPDIMKKIEEDTHYIDENDYLPNINRYINTNIKNRI